MKANLYYILNMFQATQKMILSNSISIPVLCIKNNKQIGLRKTWVTLQSWIVVNPDSYSELFDHIAHLNSASLEEVQWSGQVIHAHKPITLEWRQGSQEFKFFSCYMASCRPARDTWLKNIYSIRISFGIVNLVYAVYRSISRMYVVCHILEMF